MKTETLSEIYFSYRNHPEFLGVTISDVNQIGALDSTLLHIAARKGNISHVKVLAAAGARIDSRGDLGNTPLHDSALCNQPEVAKVLLSLGADATLKNEFGETALDVAAAGGAHLVFEAISKR